MLVDRMVHLLLREPRPIAVTDLVALTFTKKAAGEIKTRLRERLGRLRGVRLDREPGSDAEREAQEAVVRVVRRTGLSASAIDSRVEVLLYVVAPVSRHGPLVRLSYQPNEEAESRVEQTLSLLIEGIEHGEFPMIPDSYCAWCEVAPACRRRHGPSRARAQTDARASRVAGIRNATIRSGRSAP